MNLDTKNSNNMIMQMIKNMLPNIGAGAIAGAHFAIIEMLLLLSADKKLDFWPDIIKEIASSFGDEYMFIFIVFSTLAAIVLCLLKMYDSIMKIIMFCISTMIVSVIFSMGLAMFTSNPWDRLGYALLLCFIEASAIIDAVFLLLIYLYRKISSYIRRSKNMQMI